MNKLLVLFLFVQSVFALPQTIANTIVSAADSATTTTTVISSSLNKKSEAYHTFSTTTSKKIVKSKKRERSYSISTSSSTNISSSTTTTTSSTSETECEVKYDLFNKCMEDVTGAFGESVEAICQTFKTDVCKEFVNEALQSSTPCDDDKKNSKHSFAALSIKTIRMVYLSFCLTDENGNICPLSELITADVEKGGRSRKKEDPYDSMESLIPVAVTEEAKESLKKSCEIETCRKGFIAYYQITLEGKGRTDEKLKDKLTTIVNNLKQNKCDNISYSSEESNAFSISSRQIESTLFFLVIPYIILYLL